jgi:precorrin-8X/cobalt-precorrin-8 methylmutase
LDPLSQDVLERLVHSSGDSSLTALLKFSPCACEAGLQALKAGALILTDTAMAAAAVRPMAERTAGNEVRCLLDWAPAQAPPGSTRSAAAMARAWPELIQAAEVVGQPLPLVLIGSAPTALVQLLDQLDAGAPAPSLVIGMPVGFVGVPESKRRLAQTNLDQIRLDGTRGGAGLVAAAVNALLRQVAS